MDVEWVYLGGKGEQDGEDEQGGQGGLGWADQG